MQISRRGMLAAVAAVIASPATALASPPMQERVFRIGSLPCERCFLLERDEVRRGWWYIGPTGLREFACDFELTMKPREFYIRMA